MRIGKIVVTDDSETQSYIFKNVLYISKLKNELFSLTEATLDEWKFVFVEKRCTVTNDAFKIYTSIHDELYKWRSKFYKGIAAINIAIDEEDVTIKD